MSEPEPDLVVVKHSSDPATARVFVQILIAEGIPAFVNGTELMDEFAMSQKLLGNLVCDVQVPRDLEERARSVLAAAKEAGEAMADSDVWKEKDGDEPD